MQKWAQDESRSVNAHIEYLLREQAKQAGRLPGSKGRYTATIDLQQEKPELQEEQPEKITVIGKVTERRVKIDARQWRKV
ncbi:hypothetical protein J2S00_002766 [Caldalkalibacillus uzonensis]|uniref:Uncharacterized protein n=1 Tax=Caldalkalibacillus uzonensis TaxID=353224 RepID=A0ABU0CU88_9BACI|nr:hypothetical protein [Caldalkalibacillus uzonensis]MDQ0339971.1 hypothetical protein [Caldalkalibacillus uzonensis]